MIDLSLLLMAIALGLKSRLAWVIALFLLMTNSVINLFAFDDNYQLTLYSAVIIIALLFYWRVSSDDVRYI